MPLSAESPPWLTESTENENPDPVIDSTSAIVAVSPLT